MKPQGRPRKRQELSDSIWSKSIKIRLTPNYIAHLKRMVLKRAVANISEESLPPHQKNIPQELKKSKKNCNNRPSKDLLYINR